MNPPGTLRDRVAAALTTHQWGGREWHAHAHHTYAGACAVCQGDVERMADAVADALDDTRSALDVPLSENQSETEEAV